MLCAVRAGELGNRQLALERKPDSSSMQPGWRTKSLNQRINTDYLFIRVWELKQNKTKQTTNLCPGPTPRNLTKPTREYQVSTTRQITVDPWTTWVWNVQVHLYADCFLYSRPFISPGFESTGLIVHCSMTFYIRDMSISNLGIYGGGSWNQSPVHTKGWLYFGLIAIPSK